MSIANLDEFEVGEEIIDPVEEWHKKRHGKFTCSKFGDLIGEARGKGPDSFSQTALSYMRIVFAERLGSFQHSFENAACSWGNRNELAALNAYFDRTGNELLGHQYNFFELNSFVGGTPDDLVGCDGVVEAKCPYNPGEHIQTVLTKTVPKQYVWQVYGHLLVTGRKWCDFVSFDPRMPDNEERRLVVIRVDRDEQKLEFLKCRLNKANAVIEEWLKDKN